MSFETRRYLAYFQRFAFVANVGASPELSAELRAALAEYPGHSGDEAFAFATFADADAACARLEAEERAKRQRAGPEASSAGPEASSAAGTAGGTSDESDSGAESEAEDEDELRENFEDSGSDVGDADDTVGDVDDGVDVGGGAESDALEDSDSARSQSEENDASDDDASRDLLDTSASESASESDSDERAGFGFSSDDSFDDESETRDAKTFGGEHSPPRNMPVASREDEARFEREMASFLGSASEPRSVGDEKNDGKASSFAARARGDSVETRLAASRSRRWFAATGARPRQRWASPRTPRSWCVLGRSRRRRLANAPSSSGWCFCRRKPPRRWRRIASSPDRRCAIRPERSPCSRRRPSRASPAVAEARGGSEAGIEEGHEKNTHGGRLDPRVARSGVVLKVATIRLTSVARTASLRFLSTRRSALLRPRRRRPVSRRPARPASGTAASPCSAR